MKKVITLSILLLLHSLLSACFHAFCPVWMTWGMTCEAAENVVDKDIKTIRIGLIPQRSPVQLIKQWQPFVTYLSRELDRPVELVLKSDYKGVISGLKNSEMDVALLGGVAYLEARKQLKVRPLVKRLIGGTPYYQSLIVVRKDSGITTLDGLRGKQFAFTEKQSTSGYLLPYSIINSRFGKPEKFFSKILFTGNHESAFLAVLNRAVDGAGYSETRWDLNNPRLKELRIIWKSEAIPLGPFVVKDSMDPVIADQLKKAFLKFGTGETKDLAKQIEISGFVSASDKEYNVVRKINSLLKTVTARD
jgi:phosphonate transport system substrate-binding protein